MITQEVQQKNLNLFFDKLKQVGVNTELIERNLSDSLLNAPFTNINDNGMAFDGSLLHIILRTFTPYAIKLNELLPETIKVEQNKLIKICLLSQIAKCQMFIPNDNAWEVQNRQLKYKFAPHEVSLRTGIKSLILSQNMGITFSEEEVDAMTILDRDQDLQAKYFATPLATIIRQAHELTLLQFKNK